MNPLPLPQSVKDEMIRLYVEDGLPGTLSAAKVGASKTSFFRELKKRGIKARDINSWCKGKSKSLSESQIAEICRRYPLHGVTTVSLASEYGVSHPTIKHVLLINGITVKKKGGDVKMSPGAIRDMRAMYEQGLDRNIIASHFKVDPDTISHYFAAMGFDLRDCKYQQKYTIQHDFFSRATPESCYWLGFLSADGCVADNGIISLALSAKDRMHLVKFLSAIKSDYPIQDWVQADKKGGLRNYSRVMVRSREMAKTLAGFGITPRKTLTLEACRTIPDEFQRDYFRGLVDGDGCIYQSARRANGWAIELCGTQSIVIAFKDFVSQYIKTKARLKPAGKIFYFRVSGFRAAATIADVLYSNASVALDRKADLAHRLINTANNH